jgi:hypothetical protein
MGSPLLITVLARFAEPARRAGGPTCPPKRAKAGDVTRHWAYNDGDGGLRALGANPPYGLIHRCFPILDFIDLSSQFLKQAICNLRRKYQLGAHTLLVRACRVRPIFKLDDWDSPAFLQDHFSYAKAGYISGCLNVVSHDSSLRLRQSRFSIEQASLRCRCRDNVSHQQVMMIANESTCAAVLPLAARFPGILASYFIEAG